MADLVSLTVLVPRQQVPNVYAWVSGLPYQDDQTPDDAGGLVVMPQGGTPVAASGGVDPNQYPWPPALAERQFKESPPSMKQIEKVIAGKPGDWFSVEDLAKAIGAENGWKSVAGALGAFGHRVKNRYGMKSWPMEGKIENGACYYRFDAATAQIIEQL